MNEKITPAIRASRSKSGRWSQGSSLLVNAPSRSRELPENLLSGYKMQWALNRPLRLRSGQLTTHVNAYKLATQSLTFRRLIKVIDERQKRQRNQRKHHHQQQEYSEEEPPLLIDCHRSTDVNDLAFAIHFCHLGHCKISAITTMDQSDTPPMKKRGEKPAVIDMANQSPILLSTGQLHLTTTTAECSLICGLRVANTYGIESLNKRCISYVEANLDRESCWALWRTIFKPPTLPTDWNVIQIDGKAGQLLIEFMQKNFHKFMRSKNYVEMTHLSAAELKFLLASERLNVFSESEVVDVITAWVDVQPKDPVTQKLLLDVVPHLIEHCVRLEQLDKDDIDRLLQLPGMRSKRTNSTGDGLPRGCSHSNNSSGSRLDGWNDELKNMCIAMLHQRRRRLVRTSRNLRPLLTRPTEDHEGGSQCETSNPQISAWPKLAPRIPHEAIIVFGGWENGQPCRNARVLDSRKKKWITYDVESRSSLALPHPLMSFAIANVDNCVIYIAGGESRSGQATQEVLSYDFRCNSSKRGWKGCAPMHEVRRDLILVNFQNKSLYAIGGDNNRTVLDSVETLSLEKGKSGVWLEVARMIIPRGAPAGDALGSQIYVCGGYTESRMESLTNSCETYNPATNQWTLIQPMAQPRYYASGVNYQDHLFILGGGGDNSMRLTTSVMAQGYSSTVERFTPKDGVWELMPAIAERADFAACVHQDEIFCIGGGGEAFCTADTETWRPWIGRVRGSEFSDEQTNESGTGSYALTSDNTIQESSSAATPIWMPPSETDGEVTGSNPRNAAGQFGGWRRGVPLPLPLWGHRCVSISGVDKVLRLLSNESESLPPETDSRSTATYTAPQRWKMVRTDESTILAIEDTREQITEEGEVGESGKIEVRVGSTTMLVEY
ncbi:unnamed protein product [Mesocestoides corti]|uniref:BACK domain-containing protein n=1 Tax=Mesocestoides corti TaxID=53468 RepID=A0A0R3U1D0_MESCO|nr:unnamed protein product [Mesocestoides corti]